MTVITFGELLLRLSPPGEERLLESPVLHTCFGGAEANVAGALAARHRDHASPRRRTGDGPERRVCCRPRARRDRQPRSELPRSAVARAPPGPASAHRALGAPGGCADRQP